MRIPGAWPVSTILVAVATLTAGARQSPENTSLLKAATIQGHVIDGVSGLPVEGATVVVDLSPQTDLASVAGRSAIAPIIGMYHVVTSADGAFTVPDITLRRAQLRVHKAGYLNGMYGSLGVGDKKSEGWLDLADGETLSGVVVRLWQTASISGTVRDDVGDPLVNARVQILGRSIVGGLSTWASLTVIQKTDDRGAFKVLGIEPGEYLVAVPASTKAEAELAPAHDAFFAPGSRSVGGASVLSLAPGDQRTGADVVVSYRATGQTYSIAGRLVGADRPLNGVTVQLVPADTADTLTAYEGTTTLTTADSSFRFPAVAPGQYRIRVCAFPPLDSPAGLTVLPIGFFYGAPLGSPQSGKGAQWPTQSDARTWWADAPALVEDRDLPSVTVSLLPGLRIGGKVTFDDATAAPSAEDLSQSPLFEVPVSRYDLDPIPQFRLGSDGSFSSIGLPPGRYALANVFGIWKDWQPASVLSGAKELLGRVIELGTADVDDLSIVATRKKTTIEGLVQDADGQVRTDARVIVFSSEPTDWNAGWTSTRVLSYAVDRKGHYAGAILPGEYFAAAVTTLPALWTAPTFLESLRAQALRFNVGLGETKGVNVPVSQVR